MTPELVVTDDGQLVTACHHTWPIARTPFADGWQRWHHVTTHDQLTALANAGPWYAIRCWTCGGS